MLAALENCTSFLKSIRHFLMVQVDLSYLIVGPLPKSSECLDYHLKPVIQRSWSYMKDSGDFIEKIKRISNIPGNAILVMTDVVQSDPSIPHELFLKAL